MNDDLNKLAHAVDEANKVVIEASNERAGRVLALRTAFVDAVAKHLGVESFNHVDLGRTIHGAVSEVWMLPSNGDLRGRFVVAYHNNGQRLSRSAEVALPADAGAWARFLAQVDEAISPTWPGGVAFRRQHGLPLPVLDRAGRVLNLDAVLAGASATFKDLGDVRSARYDEETDAIVVTVDAKTSALAHNLTLTFSKEDP